MLTFHSQGWEHKALDFLFDFIIHYLVGLLFKV